MTITVKEIVDCRRIALRRRIWFRAINRLERGVLDLTIRYVDSIRSQKLAKLVTAIINKLTSSMENAVDYMVRKIGRPLAQKISTIAYNWGNRSARQWAIDKEFARYLAVSSNAGQARSF